MKIFQSTIFLFIISLSLQTNAQQFGAKMGVNSSNVHWSGHIFSSGDMSNTGGQFGFFGEFSLSNEKNGFYLVPEILYTMKGGTINLNDEINRTTKINYIELPLNTGYKFNVNKVCIFVKTGPYIGYAIEGLSSYSEESFRKIEFGTNGYFKRYDFGWNLVSGVEIKYIQINFSYGHGLVNCYNKDVNEKFRNRVFSFSVGHFF